MRLMVFRTFTECRPWNYGEAASFVGAERYPSMRKLVCASLVPALLAVSPIPAKAQQANQPGFDPRQTEKRFDDLESGQKQPARSGLHMPVLSRPGTPADTKPLFALRGVSLSGARAISPEQMPRPYQPYLGNNTSQPSLLPSPRPTPSLL